MLLHEARVRARRQVITRRREITGGGLLLGCTLIAIAGLRLAAAPASGETAEAATKVPGKGAAVASPKAPPEAATQASRRASAPKAYDPSAAASSRASSTSASSLPGSSPSLSRRSSASAPGASKPPRRAATAGYVRAPGGTARRGSGTLRTYRVEVETRTGQSPSAFAAAVDATLADAASWTGQGRWSLQRVDDDADFVIRLATPATVDKVCLQVGLHTDGYVSCRSGHFVMLNLNRWLHAVPQYHGDVARYRHYLVNHEVGHQLGYVHQACPGPGRLAPVMQQQTYGLKGCLANGWPYVDGKLVSGPSAP
jgi:hypothetical protein